MANDKNLPATTPKQKTEIQQYSLTSASSILKMADELTRFIKERKLIQNIQGKEFVLVEAWTFAGMSMGLMPIPVKVTNISSGDELKYEAVVELLNIHTNQVVGRGFAICSNKENGKRHFAEYAIASMAQTRATSKAYRLPLGFLMKAAGFEATPAEEMEFQQAEVVAEPAPQEAAPVMKVEPEQVPAPQDIKDVLLLNLEGFKGLYKSEDLEKIKKTIETLTADKVGEIGKKISAGITKRVLVGRGSGLLNHAASTPQLDLIDKMLLSRVFTAEEKAAFNTASYEYDNIDAANRIEWLTVQMKERKAKAKAA